MPAAQYASGASTILACDDERHILRLIEVNLTRQGHEVVCVASGLECLDRLVQRSYDVLILDGELSSPSTNEILETVHGDSRHSNMRIILLGEKRDGEPPQGPPAVYLTKPFNPALVVALLG